MAVHDAVRSSKVLIANVCERKQQTHDPNGNDRQNERNTTFQTGRTMKPKKISHVSEVSILHDFSVFSLIVRFQHRALPGFGTVETSAEPPCKAQLEGKGGLAILITSNDFQSFPCIFLL